MRDNKRSDRGSANPRKLKNISVSVESLEGRGLLSVPAAYPIYGPPPVTMPKGPAASGNLHASGIVTKAPHFYQIYTGPKLAELNAVKASAKLARNGSFTFTGTNKGAITTGPAVYVWGIDRSGHLPAGPFTARPGIKFDAVVVVSLDSSLNATAKVIDESSGVTTVLPAGSVSIHGRTIAITVAGNLLPSTGLTPSHYRFNFWPEDGGPPASSSVASFAPERTTAQVGTREVVRIGGLEERQAKPTYSIGGGRGRRDRPSRGSWARGAAVAVLHPRRLRSRRLPSP